MAQQAVSDDLSRWCKPELLSPTSWITGFSDNSETFFCAIAGGQADLAQNMQQHCCKGEVQQSDDGCYHWCSPHATKTDDWATCISDHVYVDTLAFGTSCNAIGDIERKNAYENHVQLRPGPDPSLGVSLGRSSRLGVFLGIVILIQAVF